MKYIPIIICSISLIVSSLIFKVILSKRKSIDNTNYIKWPKVFIYICIVVLFILYILLPVLSSLELDPTLIWYEALFYWYVCLLPFRILSIGLTIYILNWKIILDVQSFQYVNMWGKTKIYNYKDVIIKHKQATLRVYIPKIDKKGLKKLKLIINISYYCDNYEKLYNLWKENN